jgi:hypothetical protein
VDLYSIVTGRNQIDLKMEGPAGSWGNSNLVALQSPPPFHSSLTHSLYNSSFFHTKLYYMYLHEHFIFLQHYILSWNKHIIVKKRILYTHTSQKRIQYGICGLSKNLFYFKFNAHAGTSRFFSSSFP